MITSAFESRERGSLFLPFLSSGRLQNEVIFCGLSVIRPHRPAQQVFCRQLCWTIPMCSSGGAMSGRLRFQPNCRATSWRVLRREDWHQRATRALTHHVCNSFGIALDRLANTPVDSRAVSTQVGLLPAAGSELWPRHVGQDGRGSVMLVSGKAWSASAGSTAVGQINRTLTI